MLHVWLFDLLWLWQPLFPFLMSPNHLIVEAEVDRFSLFALHLMSALGPTFQTQKRWSPTVRVCNIVDVLSSHRQCYSLLYLLMDDIQVFCIHFELGYGKSNDESASLPVCSTTQNCSEAKLTNRSLTLFLRPL